MTIHLATLHIPRRHLRKRKSWTIIGLFYVPLEFQPKVKNWIYHHSTGFLNYTSIFQTVLYCCVCQMLHETSFQLLTCILSAVKTGLKSYCDTSYSRGGVNQMLILQTWPKKNGQRRYKYLVLGRDISYFVKHHSDSTKKFSEADIFNILEFLIDNIFAMFGGRVFQQSVGIPLGTNCAPLLADLFLYSYEADFIQGLLKKNEK